MSEDIYSNGGHGPVYNPNLIVWRGKIINEKGEEEFRVEPVSLQEWNRRDYARKRRLAEHDLVEYLRLRGSGVIGLWRFAEPGPMLHAEYLLVVDTANTPATMVRDRYLDRWRQRNETMLVRVEKKGTKAARPPEDATRLIGEDR